MVKVDNKSASLYVKSKLPFLRTLSEPLKNYLGIDFFGYKRYYPELKKYLFISTNEEWMDYHLTSVLSHGQFFSSAMSQFADNELQCVVWPEQPTDVFLQSLFQHGMWHGINFYLKSPTHIDLWTFSTAPSVEQFKFLRINIMEDLKKFIVHFINHAGYFVESNKSDYLASLPLEKISPCESAPLPNIQEFRNQFNYIPFLWLDNQLKELTKREAQCLHEVSCGRSMKECARLLDISPRTVEVHLNNMKIKTGLCSKNALIACYLQTVSRFNTRL